MVVRKEQDNYESEVYEMSTKLAQTYDIDSIMHYLINHSHNTNNNRYTEEGLREYKTTILEHILRKEATIDVSDNKIVGFHLCGNN